MEVSLNELHRASLQMVLSSLPSSFSSTAISRKSAAVSLQISRTIKNNARRDRSAADTAAAPKVRARDRERQAGRPRHKARRINIRGWASYFPASQGIGLESHAPVMMYPL